MDSSDKENDVIICRKRNYTPRKTGLDLSLVGNWTWIFPLAILVLLLIAPAFRWEYTAEKTINNTIYTWKTDRWSNTNWMVMVNTRGLREETEIKSPYYRTTRERATTIWEIAVGLVSILTVVTWFLPIYEKNRKPTKIV